jgi:hypothetical protein
MIASSYLVSLFCMLIYHFSISKNKLDYQFCNLRGHVQFHSHLDIYHSAWILLHFLSAEQHAVEFHCT